MIEKERKFLVIDSKEFQDSLPFSGEFIVQIYIVDREDHSLRIRIINNKHATICYKYYLDAESKEEHEYTFPLKKAYSILEKKEYKTFLAKMRYKKDGWDIDNYPDFDITVAEYEFNDENPLPDPLPNWVGEEVTGQYEYTNPALAKRYSELK